MKKSGSQYKGDSFEKLVFNKLKELIQCQSIPGVSRYNEIFLHKQYASKTAPDILLNPDITIEIYADSSKRTWSNLLVVECKNHKRYLQPIVTQYLVCNKSEIWP